jgi:arsenite/tail-anchored protein-transporting ATPase
MDRDYDPGVHLPTGRSMTRIIVYTGKGGVGKTSIAASTALLSADRGLRTIVLSTDIAHSLGDAFGLQLGPEPVEIAPNLWAQEPNVYFNIGRYWGTIQAYMTQLFSWRGLDSVMAEEMTVLPGMDELGNLLWIADHVESGLYDVIVVDAAPTGETLRLLSLPEASRWWIDRIAPIGRRVSRLGRPVIERMIGVPVPRDEVFAAAERLLDRLDRVHRLLADPEQSSIRLVLALEQLAIAEARRSFTYFHLFGYPSDLVICNRVLPPGVDGYFAGLRLTQQGYLPSVEADFAPVPVRTVPFLDREVVGLEGLREIGRALFGAADPASFFYRGRPYRIVSSKGVHILEVALPFTSRAEVGLSREGDDLVIQVGAWRRTLVLPRALMALTARGARMEAGVLRIEFSAMDKSSNEESRDD